MADGEGSLGLGRPIARTQLHVVDRELELVPVGVAGELLIGGAGVARGYWGRPDLTAERFLPDSWSAVEGARLYRTGDLVRHRPDGELEFLGRIDHQIKLRGFRIELGEIESVLASHPAVREAVVLLRADLPGGGGLVAYVVSDAGEVQPLRGWLEERLPGYMVPSAFVALESLPLTPNGKVDRKALERVAPELERGAAGWQAPRTPAEELLAGIWAQVLGLERVGVEESFFALGGHSLLATQVMSRVKDVFGVELPLRRLFASPTVAALAVELENAAGETGTLALARVTRGRDLPLSFAQQRLWFLEQLQPGSPVYNLPAGLRLRGELSVPALRAALSEVMRRHESLRTTFVAVDGQPLQRVHPATAMPLDMIDLGALSPREREGELARLAREHAERPFDLVRGPLFRGSLVRLGAADHAVLLSQHHIVSDGWSTGILVREVVALYSFFAAGAAGAPSPLPELAIQYPDFAVWQRRWLTGEVLERQVSYWRERLAGLPSLLELPTDRPRPAVRSDRGSRHAFSLPLETLRKLKDLGRQMGVTEFMTLLGLFQALLSRLSGQEQLAVGTVIANRGRSELEPLIGFFANTLVMRGDLSGRPSLREVLVRSRESALEAYAHQDLPFEHLVEALQPVRAMSYTPLFQVMLVLQNAPQQALALPGLEAVGIEGSYRTGGARFDLTLDLLESPFGLAGALEYSTDLFDRTTILRLAEQLVTLIAEAVAAPSRPVTELPLLGASERQQLAVEWNDTEVVGGTAARIHELFEEQAARRPEAPAVSGQGETLSYGELEARSNRLAHHLRGLGVGPETRVGLCVGRSPEMVVALLGILKTGGAYVPLDPHHPAERLALVLGDSAPAVLVTEERWLERLGAEGDPGPLVVCLDRDRERIATATASRLALPSEGGAESLAYVIYTSGSTGRPKGVCLPHGAVVNFLAAMAERLEVGAEDVIPALTTLTFDIAGLEIYLPLALGGRVEVVGSEETGDGRQLAARVAASGVTAMQATPATWRLLVDSGWEGLPGLKALCGGEALPRALASELLARGVTLWNLYGPTETAVWSAAGAVEGGEGSLGLGRPIARTQLHVVDRDLELVPVGVAGELLIGGAGVARGYWRRPDLTAERFLPDPWSGAGARLYRTGDLVRHRPDGELEFLGRIDHQIKLRGFRIELGEIESVLAGHPAVREAVVLLRNDLPGGGGLVAYVVSDGGEVQALRGWLEERLPGYMVPMAFVALESLPLTPNGKVDRKALERIAPELERGAAGWQAPRTPAEELLAGIWAQVLGVERVGVEENFFELGGHSLLATQVMSRVKDVFGVELPLRRLFASPTVAALAAELENAAGETGTLALARVTRGRDLPLSFAQQRLWFLEQLQPGSPVYNLPAGLRLRGELAVPALRAALSEVMRRHESLRTTFVAVDGQPLQQVHPATAMPLDMIDLGALSPREREGELARLAREHAERPFDLVRGPLFRGSLVRLGGGRPRGAARSAPHRLGWLVDGDPGAGGGRSLQCFRRRRSPRHCRSSPSSTRTSRHGSGAGFRARCWSARWATGASGSRACRRCSSCCRDRPAAPGRALRSRVAARLLPPLETLRKLGKDLGRQMGVTEVHDPAMGAVPGAALPAVGAGATGGGDGDRQPRPLGAGAADRLLRQHAGDAGGSVGPSEPARGAGAQPGERARGLCSSGPAF